MILPPATSSVTPVSHDELSEARNSVASATSSGAPMRPSKNASAHCLTWFAGPSGIKHPSATASFFYRPVHQIDRIGVS
jgi:hypothetical protein